MERCPNCGARCGGNPQCRRCGMELGGLLAIERAAERHLARAVERLGAGDTDAAIGALELSCRLKRTELAEQLLRFQKKGPAPNGAWLGKP